MNDPQMPPVITEEPKKNNTLLYVIIGVVVLCGCCATLGALYWLWNNGDRLLQGTNLLMQVL